MELGHLRIFAVLVGSFIYFLRDAKYISTIFVCGAPAGNLSKIECTWVEYYVSRWVTVPSNGRWQWMKHLTELTVLYSYMKGLTCEIFEGIRVRNFTQQFFMIADLRFENRSKDLPNKK
jgi:hypothetical protein